MVSIVVDQTSAPQQVANALREALLRGEIPPGSKLGEARLTEIIGVSRHTLRSAFRILESEGLLEQRLHRGVVVPELSEERIADAFRARKALEWAGINAIDLSDIGRGVIGQMRSAVDLMSDSRNEVQLAIADLDFHCAVVSASGSQMITSLYRNIQAQLRLTRAWAIRSRGNSQLMVSTHGAVIEHLLEGDQEKAVAALMEIFELAEKRLMTAMQKVAGTSVAGAIWPPADVDPMTEGGDTD